MPNYYLIDLFCGAGGTSTAAQQAGFQIIACINHDAKAIQTHQLNHSDCLHYIEDIRTIPLQPIVELVANIRASDPDAVMVLWASLECTNHSNAKGGLPRDADSRSLAEHLHRYIDELNPDLIGIENVREFMAWGDLTPAGKPVSRDKGRHYLAWVNSIQCKGYNFDSRLLMASDFGAVQNRLRYFAWLAKPQHKINFPQPTHGKPSKTDSGMFGGTLQPHRAVRKVLEMDNVGESIFNRKTPYVEKTLERIYYGLVKFGGTFLSQRHNTQRQSRVYSVDTPNRTAQHAFVQMRYGGTPVGKVFSVAQPARTVTCRDHQEVVSLLFTKTGYNPDTRCWSIDRPTRTVLIIQHHFTPGSLTPVSEPTATVTTVNKQSKVSFLLNPQFSNTGNGIDIPAPTVIASQAKRPLSLVQATHEAHTAVYPAAHVFFPIGKANNTKRFFQHTCGWKMLHRIKSKCNELGITDIRMRMLTVSELLQIQGFDKNYNFCPTATLTDQKKFIGNAVEVTVGKALFKAIKS
jgi:DNA (cytosine-5)-methyltransferase 1